MYKSRKKDASEVLKEMSRLGQEYKEEMNFNDTQCSECFHSLYEVNSQETMIERTCKIGGFKICSLGTCKEFKKERK